MCARKSKMLKPVIKSMFSRNVANYFIILGIAIFLLLPMVFVNSADSILAMVKQDRGDVYGEFTDIYYDYNVSGAENEMLIDENYISRVFGDMAYKRYGVLYVVEQIKVYDEKYNLGYADDTAAELGRIALKEGELPRNEAEIAITESALKVLGAEVKVGDSVNVSGENYVVTGIVDDYGRLWPKGEKQSESDATDIDFFVCKDTAIDRYNKNSFLSYVVMIDRNTDISSDIQYSEDFYYNTNGQLGDEENLFYVPDGFIVIIFVVCTFLLFNILFMAKRKIDRKYYIFWRLGLSKKYCRLYVSVEMLVNAIIGNILGCLLGNLGTKAAIGILEQRIGKTIPVIYNISIVIFMILADTIILVALGNVLYGISKKVDKRKIHIHKPKKSGICRLAFLEFSGNRKTFITMFIMLAVSISFIYYINEFNSTFVEKTEYEEVPGKMPLDYDYELYTELMATTAMSEDDICIVDTYERDGATDVTLKEISDLSGVEKAYGYKENNKIYILEEQDAFCDYIDISDYFLDGMYNSTDISPELNMNVGYGDNTVIRTKVMGYTEEDILGFEKYVAEGKIDINKLNSGEEIILVVPAFKYYVEEFEDGSIGSTLEPIEYNLEGAINDTMYHVGDEVTLSELKVLSDTNGGMNESEIATNIERKDVKVKIGAIIRSSVGWFERETPLGSTYKFISTNDGFASYGIDVTYNRIRIYAEDSADINLLTNELFSIASNYPRMTLDNLTSQLKNYRELNYLVSLMCILLISLVFIVGVVTTVTQMLSKTKIYKEYYRLYRMNGLHFGDVIYLFFIQIVIVIAIAIIIMLPISCLIMYSLGVTSLAIFWGIMNSIDMIRLLCIYFAVIIMICVASSAICVRNFEKS